MTRNGPFSITYGTCGIQHPTARVVSRCINCYQQRQIVRGVMLAALGIGIVITSFSAWNEIKHADTAVIPNVVSQEFGTALVMMRTAGFEHAEARSCDTGYGTTILAVTKNGNTRISAVGTDIYVGTRIVLWCDREFTLLNR